MTTKTVDQLCARDIGTRVRFVSHDGDVNEGHLGHVLQYGKRGRFAIFGNHAMYEIQVGQFSHSGIDGRKEVELL